MSTTALNYMLYPPKLIRKNKTNKVGKLKGLVKKVKFIAKNVIFIKNFSNANRDNIKKTNFSKSPIILKYPESNTLFSDDEFELKIISGCDKLLAEAQLLRYQSFFENENSTNKSLRIDSDQYDDFSEHLVVIDKSYSSNKVVGTYRLLNSQKLPKNVDLYTSTEFNIENLLVKNEKILEVGRSCVDKNYRDGRIIKLLWRGLASQIVSQNVDLVIGCASFFENNVDKIKDELSYLIHFHCPPENYDSFPLTSKKVNLKIVKKEDLELKKVFRKLPPLIKAYTRTGAWIGKGAVLDDLFNTIDVCIILKSKNMHKKYINLAKEIDR